LLKRAWIVLAVVPSVVFAAGVLSVAAHAQAGPGICAIANTCSEAFFQCVTVNCPANRDASCTGSCRSQFDGCMRTGAFGGRGSHDCRDKTLIRK
jgi:hypothetical protein